MQFVIIEKVLEGIWLIWEDIIKSKTKKSLGCFWTVPDDVKRIKVITRFEAIVTIWDDSETYVRIWVDTGQTVTICD